MTESSKQYAYRFEIDGEELLAQAEPQAKQETKVTQDAATARLLQEKLDEIRVRIGTLLKTETVSFLLGAGASVDCGGPLIGTVPVEVENNLLEKGTTDKQNSSVEHWVKVFYLAVRHCTSDSETPTCDKQILDRAKSVKDANAPNLPANYERVLATLYRWRVALPEAGGRLQIEGPPRLDASSKDLDTCLREATYALARACHLPAKGKEDGLNTHKTFLRKLLTRPLNLRRVNIFTLNYDTLVEQAADAEGIVLIDGFIGTQRRIFRPECYEQDLYFPAETTEGHVHRFDRVLHLYKLHGSITWRVSEPSVDNPYGIESKPDAFSQSDLLLIYPTPAKYGETLGMPYSELFRRFAAAIVRPQSVLFVVGYGFGDEHVNAIIRQALAVPSFTLVIIDPKPKSKFVEALRQQKDRRVWIASGSELGTFRGFVDLLLPDLRDEEIQKRVIATYSALGKISSTQEGPQNDG
jgi:hypothetical protein